MRIPSRRVVVLALCAALALTGAVGSLTGNVHAAPSGGVGSVAAPVYTHRTVTTINFAGTALCATLKKAQPKQAANPALCTAIHIELSTDLTPLPGHTTTLGISPKDTCIGGSHTWTDEYKDPLSFDMYMKNTFTWYYNCAAPKVTYQECWFAWLLGNNQHESCKAQYPNNIYSDLKHSITFNPDANPILVVTVWQERSAYYDGSYGCCTDLQSGC